MRILILFCALLISISARAQDAPGDYGPYHANNKQIRLSNGDTLVVYRVKYWQFDDGSAPALQIEYESPVSIDDTVAVIHQALRIWPAFVQYVEAGELSEAIISATNLTKRGGPGHWVTSFKHFGLIAERDSAGAWRFRGRQGVLPPAENPTSPTIFEADGAPVALKMKFEEEH